ncbi:PDGLE domain-containing protein [Pseudonocardia asaccharolytica]|uniref:Membrane protein n=1 Tax=Pseudonocardia asaccharolytica DSM 44247 = NBRC 16224 TaxID=1123024 RepID=A0A511CW71_9PSEU|nr:PDGLE domain-containing protein [Pseudonocardia asaccharolytica]GEL16717.1 membrane protein [Pseudonocardia asaccharolytica DSM 44247 = NBRC 16224]
MNRAGTTRRSGFLLGFLAVALLVAGVLSYFASSSPDGLDSVTLHGCQITEIADREQLDGQCIAQNAQGHALAAGPLADYTVRGGEGTVGLAGVIGVMATLALAGGVFWVLRRRGPHPPTRED